MGVCRCLIMVATACSGKMCFAELKNSLKVHTIVDEFGSGCPIQIAIEATVVVDRDD
jgi:hypothetical protein